MTQASGNGWRPSDELIEAGLNEVKNGFKSLFKGIGEGVKSDAGQLKEEVKAAGEKLKPEPSQMQRDIRDRQVRKDKQLEVLVRIADTLDRIEGHLATGVTKVATGFRAGAVEPDRPLRDPRVPDDLRG